MPSPFPTPQDGATRDDGANGHTTSVAATNGNAAADRGAADATAEYGSTNAQPRRRVLGLDTSTMCPAPDASARRGAQPVTNVQNPVRSPLYAPSHRRPDISARLLLFRHRFILTTSQAMAIAPLAAPTPDHSPPLTPTPSPLPPYPAAPRPLHSDNDAAPLRPSAPAAPAAGHGASYQ